MNQKKKGDKKNILGATAAGIAAGMAAGVAVAAMADQETRQKVTDKLSSLKDDFLGSMEETADKASEAMEEGKDKG